MKEASPSDTNVLARALRGGSYLFLQKLVTFAINSFILRRLHLSVTGAVTVQFELALATVFLFRDGFRLAFLRMPSLLEYSAVETEDKEDTPRRHRQQKQQQQQVINAAWLSTGITWALAGAIAVTATWRSHEAINPDKNQGDTSGLQGYKQVLVMYCLAAMIEAAAEPMYLLAHSSVLVGWQVSAQGFGFVVRALVQYLSLFVFQLDGLLSYGLAELAYASTLLTVFLWLFYWKLRANRESSTTNTAGRLISLWQLLPRRTPAGSAGYDEAMEDESIKSSVGALLDRDLVALLMPLGLQSVVKYLLTEGDKWVLSLFTTMQQMGIYGIVFHLGSLVPRIVFFPLEEATKTVISKMGTTTTTTQAHGELVHAKRFVLILLKLMHLIGLVFACFGTSYAYTLVLLLYGPEKAQHGVGSALAMYCLYIPFLGLNGICEAFVHAVGDKKELMRLNQLMAVFFLVYAASSMVLTWVLHLDTVGIILANCINMCCRILYCMTFMAAYFARHQLATPHQQQTPNRDSFHAVRKLLSFWREALPDRVVLVAFAASLVITASSQRMLLAGTTEESWIHHGLHVVIGGGCFLAVLVALYVRERRLIREELRLLQTGGGGDGSSATSPLQKAHQD